MNDEKCPQIADRPDDEGIKALSPPSVTTVYALPRCNLNNLPVLSRHRNNSAEQHRGCQGILKSFKDVRQAQAGRAAGCMGSAIIITPIVSYPLSFGEDARSAVTGSIPWSSAKTVSLCRKRPYR